MVLRVTVGSAQRLGVLVRLAAKRGTTLAPLPRRGGDGQGRMVEVGGYLGGSAVAAALADLGVEVVSVESFASDGSGSVDGWPLPDLRTYFDTVRLKFPTLRLTPLPLPSKVAARQFQDGSLDMVFIDGCHAEKSVREDIAGWMAKVRPGGIIAGDDAEWPGVRAAVTDLLDGKAKVENCVWWVEL